MRTHSLFIPHGYVAIVSAIILATILTVLAFGESESAFWDRYSQLDQENHLRSKLLGDSCAYEVLLQYSENPISISTSSSEEILINSQNTTSTGNTCTVDSVSVTSGAGSFIIHANVANAYDIQNLNVSRNLSSGVLSVTSWRDITSTPP